MILNATIVPQKYPRAFTQWTRISLQVRGGATVFIAKDQGEAANQNDGMQLTQASTNPPYDKWVIGDFWYSANIDNSPLNLEIEGYADQYFHP